ncbi:MAG: polyhydroxyalkanoate depolymerase [Nisaea sp.]|jgi:poly(3-hydroxybutyrate) depolymerase|uniref:polyhydroxyalkanoate depolymerase n=1 Tax=Nisaea sp. TaxID=2024842 RepID=UPI001AFE4AD2|nr:polyhydroxyalkanoate depolymerase [Nisaea sp.]MBO6561514.1 polyhydroxyalkanoate depolymerase [Nisaea sp.]
MLYHMYEATRMAIMPWRLGAQAVRNSVMAPWSPLSYTPIGRQIGSAAELFERVTRRYGKPEWGLEKTVIDGKEVAVEEDAVIHRAYCSLVNFKRDTKRKDPKLLVVAPLSGHYATLLRGTVEAMLPDHDVYVTDWNDCRYVPITSDRFNLNDYIDYIIDFLHYLGPNTHVIAVCQPSVPVLAAVSVMSGWGDICAPASMTLMGGPIDTRRNPTAVNKLAKEHAIEWFERHVVTMVPPPYPGMGRRVYPGFIQLTNFISMNLDRHMISLNELFDHLVQGDDEEADKRKAFYEEYLAVMDLPAEFYLQTVETVFQKHSLPKGEMIARWHPVKPEAITRTAICCVEGELDDISGVGQTRAALDLASNLPDSMKHYHLQKNVGHYGIFNGGRWRREIAPMVKEFIRTHDHELGAKSRKLHAIAG